MVGMTHGVHADYMDATFVPARQTQEGDVIEGVGFTLQAVFTPGHVSNHFSFLLREEQLLFVGDHLMQGATVILVPTHGGNLWDYLNSLEKLKGRGLSAWRQLMGTFCWSPIKWSMRLLPTGIA